MTHFFNWLFSLSTHDWFDIGTRAVTVCSILYTVLPPYETFADYPSLLKAYKLFLSILGSFAVNGRSRLYPSISTNSGNTTSPAAQSAPGGPTGPAPK